MKIRTYEAPGHHVEGQRLPTELYPQAAAAFVIFCVDVVIIDRARKTFWLVRRVIKPADGEPWWLGGRVTPGTRVRTAVPNIFKRETGVDLPEEHFEMIELHEAIWDTRQEEPQGVGRHDFTLMYAVELSAEERAEAARMLEGREYDRAFGLQEYDRARLVAEQAHPLVLGTYDAIFPD